jgi:hypothetical protein
MGIQITKLSVFSLVKKQFASNFLIQNVPRIIRAFAAYKCSQICICVIYIAFHLSEFTYHWIICSCHSVENAVYELQRVSHFSHSHDHMSCHITPVTHGKYCRRKHSL